VIAPEFQEIVDEYFSSTRELLESGEQLLMEMEREEGHPSAERVQDLKRTFHTLKGNSAMMGFEVVANVAHLMEDILGAVGGNNLGMEEDLIALLLSGMGLISEVVRSGQVPDETPASWSGILQDLRRMSDAIEAALPQAAEAPGPADVSRVRSAGGASRTDAQAALPTADDLKRRYLGTTAKSLRVSQSKLDALLEIAGEIHILLTGVTERVKRLAARGEEGAELTLQVERLTKSFGLLQDEIFAVRLVPVGSVFSHFRRLVRDLAQGQGKFIDFQVSGEETTLDKAVVDQLNEPLLHLIRNSVDHGIESPSERRNAGKSEVATVTLAARQTSNLVEIAVVDDGRGIDTARVAAKAREMGILVDGLDENAILNLVFLPEFSTKDDITELSGRGVGLDVVKTALERFGGSVKVQTLPGQGTEFRLTFPLTLAVAHALLIAVDDEVYALPMSALVETFRLEPGSMHEIARRGVLLWRDQLLSVIDTGRLFHTGGRDEADRSYVLVIGGEGKRKALLVDRPLGHQLIVVKSLDESLGKPFGISGATLLGSGRIVMIVDARQILETHLDEMQQPAMARAV
jgi:two-component system, chemotaxis family, sensor kinase CheA